VCTVPSPVTGFGKSLSPIDASFVHPEIVDEFGINAAEMTFPPDGRMSFENLHPAGSVAIDMIGAMGGTDPAERRRGQEALPGPADKIARLRASGESSRKLW
jgi:hypothetical protein